MFPSIEAKITSVRCEREAAALLDDTIKIPDAIAELDCNGKRANLIIEIYNKHSKSEEDAIEYARQSNMDGVIEIDVSDIMESDQNLVKGMLRKKILTHDDEERRRRYWLYSPKARKRFESVELTLLLSSEDMIPYTDQQEYDEMLCTTVKSLMWDIDSPYNVALESRLSNNDATYIEEREQWKYVTAPINRHCTVTPIWLNISEVKTLTLYTVYPDH